MDESPYGTFPRFDVFQGKTVHFIVGSALAKYHAGLFMQFGPLKGKDWLRRMTAENRKVFSDLGRSHAPADLPTIGGKARALTARRLPNGRFAKKGGNDVQAEAISDT